MNNEEKIIAMLEEQGKRLDKVDARLDKMDARLDKVDARLDKMDADVLAVRTLVDVDIDKRLNLLAEGHDAIVEQLIPVSRVDAMESDIVVLKEAVRALSSRLKELEAQSA